MSERWQEDFSRYATGVAFSIQLSKAQVLALDAIQSHQWRGGRFTMFFSTAGALIRRGLAERTPNQATHSNWDYKLTPAGEAVLELVRLSGALPANRNEEAA